MDWSISIDVEGPPGSEVSADRLETLLDKLQRWGGVVSGAGNRYGAIFNVTGARSASRAIETAVGRFVVAADTARLDQWPIVRLEAMTAAEQDREIERPLYPELVGVTEAAEILGVKPQRISQLVQSAKPRFPAPMYELKATPVWTRWQIERFRDVWDRTPGPPKKQAVTAG